LASGLTGAIDIQDHPRLSRSIHQPTRLLVIRVVGVGREWAALEIIEKERAQGFNGGLGQRC